MENRSSSGCRIYRIFPYPPPSHMVKNILIFFSKALHRKLSASHPTGLRRGAWSHEELKTRLRLIKGADKELASDLKPAYASRPDKEHVRHLAELKPAFAP